MESEININDVVNYLNRAFNKATYKNSNIIGKQAVRTMRIDGKWETTPLYDYQVDFAYLINEIQRAPLYNARKAIHKANYLIREIEQNPVEE